MTSIVSTPLIQAMSVARHSVRRDLGHRVSSARRRVGLGAGEGASPVAWQVHDLDLRGRNFRFRVTEEVDRSGDEPIWAINIHGYFAGGSMYARESERLATRLGWRVVNPSLPGFGGSDPLDWGELTINSLSDHIDIIRRELGIGRCVLIGHSMGGAVAVDYASRHPHDVLGLIYRDGIATPEWQVRHGVLSRVLAPVLPDAAPMIDLMAAVALDAPDFLVGHMFSTIRALIPDLRSNVRTLAHSAPVAMMLMHMDLTEAVHHVAAEGIPIYGAWGCFDHVVSAPAADAFARAAGVEIQWVPGGHSWMLARPSGLSDLLTHVPSGIEFAQRLEARAAQGPRRHLRRVV
jgi:pimeloyl-ACP methyl ester carboxylesterase